MRPPDDHAPPAGDDAPSSKVAGGAEREYWRWACGGPDEILLHDRYRDASYTAEDVSSARRYVQMKRLPDRCSAADRRSRQEVSARERPLCERVGFVPSQTEVSRVIDPFFP